MGLWKKVICGKYGLQSSDWFPRMEISRLVSTVWRDILSLEWKNTELFNLFLRNIRFCVGRGYKLSFWRDDLLGGGPLKNLHHRLFSLSAHKEGSLGDFFKLGGLKGRWRLEFRRNLFSWEEEDLRRLLDTLGRASVLRFGSDDTLLWNDVNFDGFVVKSVYNMLQVSWGQECGVLDFVWKSATPLKVRCFVWLA